MLIVLPNPGSAFSGDGLGWASARPEFLFCFEETTQLLYTYVLLLFRTSDDENHGSISPRMQGWPSGEERDHRPLWENQTTGQVIEGAEGVDQ